MFAQDITRYRSLEEHVRPGFDGQFAILTPRLPCQHDDRHGRRACVESQATRQLQTAHGTSTVRDRNDHVRWRCCCDPIRQNGCRNSHHLVSPSMQSARMRFLFVDRVTHQQN
jgi:hypothetical protein